MAVQPRAKGLDWTTINQFPTRAAAFAYFTPQVLAARELHWGNTTTTGQYISAYNESCPYVLSYNVII